MTYNYSHRHPGQSRQRAGWRLSELRAHGGSPVALRSAREHWLEWASGDRPALPWLQADTLPLPPLPHPLPGSAQLSPPDQVLAHSRAQCPQNWTTGLWGRTWASSLSQPLCHQLWWPHCSQRPNRVIFPHANAHHPASSPLSSLGQKVSPKDLSLVTFPIYIWLQ